MKTPIAVKVLPNIWLGDSSVAENSFFFKTRNICAVLNMTANIPNFFKNENIEYLRIPVYDNFEKRDSDKMLEYFPIVSEFIFKNSVIEEKNILVHCAKGRQRSCAAVAAYLVKFYKMSPFQAMEFISKQKNDAFHYGKSVNFAKSINKWFHIQKEKDDVKFEKL